MVSVDFSGLAPKVSHIIYGANKVIHAEAEKIIAEAKQLVPLDKGELHDSGRIDPSPSGAGVVISFYEMNGDHDVALDQHENMDYVHDVGRTDHYLSKPAYRIGQEIARRVAEGLGE